ncbi:unnamed protein product [Angiostrongylus costaricensis]|uniref:Ricin B-type lectin domain-containing protein n=1 Tax=Angiostrongylus costaricensis TaxID=334426 RepID=A0A0R3PD23_ANGCS|nr:unnamed protein product [Angiostrongylus costaricensis]
MEVWHFSKNPECDGRHGGSEETIDGSGNKPLRCLNLRRNDEDKWLTVSANGDDERFVDGRLLMGDLWKSQMRTEAISQLLAGRENEPMIIRSKKTSQWRNHFRAGQRRHLAQLQSRFRTTAVHLTG